jgi:DNA-binding CsgD family transcriptional regulator
VGVATLSLLTTAAEENPVLCVVDDAHWLDQASSDALLFCARRIGADRVAMVFAARSGSGEGFEAPGLPELELGGLDAAAARTLLASRLGAPPAEEVGERLVVETRGNPLALLELPAQLTEEQLSGAAVLPDQLHLPAHVERAFLDRCRRLSVPAQSVLLLAAADGTGDLVALRRASRELELGDDALEEALASGLLYEDEGAVRVRHPLVRSAIYQAAGAGEKRRVHRVLAAALAAHGDPDRVTWHRAAAAEGPDDEVAVALADVASRALRRGGYAAALAAYERAAALTEEASRRPGLLFAAARSAWACGEAARARALIGAAREGAVEPLLVCDLARLRGHIEVNVGSAVEAHRIFVEAARDVRATDGARALDIAAAAAVMRTFGADSGTRLPVTDLARAKTTDEPRTRCLHELLTAMTSAAEGAWGHAVVELDQALGTGAAVDDRDVLWNLGNAALQLDDRAQQRFYEYALSRAREEGAVTAVIYVLQRACFGHFASGDLVALRTSAEEARDLAASIGQPGMTALPLAWLALLDALQGGGDFGDLRRRTEEVAATHQLGITAGPVHDLLRWARGIQAAGDGDPVGALHHLRRLRLPFMVRLAAVTRLEAAARAGDLETARVWTDELVGFAQGTGRPWAAAAVSFGRAVCSDEVLAEEHFEDALAHHAGGGRPLDEARTQLAYGEWLRRNQRRVDSRTPLRRALDTFHDLRASALADRAHDELRASGETARKRDPSTLLDLTPTELRIAQLVSNGMSNKEVAAQCWVSPRTVAFHLRNVFAKAGISSRGELVRLDLT